jgi:hypothetical protein
VGRWFKNFLALVGGLALLAGAARFLPTRGDEAPFPMQEIRSSDGRYKAILLSENGGGAIAPYCIHTVVVLPVAAKIDAHDDAQVVYVGGCGTFSDPVTNQSRNGPDLKWLGSHRLEIHFPQESVGGVAAMRLKRDAVMGNVTVTYRIDNND